MKTESSEPTPGSNKKETLPNEEDQVQHAFCCVLNSHQDHELFRQENKKKTRRIMQRAAVMKKNTVMKKFQVHQHRMSKTTLTMQALMNM